MEYESIMNMVAYNLNPVIELVSMGVVFGFGVVTILSFIAYGIFKAFALLSVKKQIAIQCNQEGV